ncbi:MAG: NADH:ubiquinone reductase (Na(+)-transporting) subunit B [Thermoguttaceae bacterium]|jgi:Na+-transporting NADH:ubiquinone oxidoreductase subunit B|nr:NADH:ubiquinone reductase (Na(+)-transporting) subunit B [Thermoguttaceae bacterium]
MRLLRKVLDRVAPTFEEGGRLSVLYPLFDAVDTFLYTPANNTSEPVHVRDAVDFKRMMITVALALFPCGFMAIFNTGLQANRAMAVAGLSATSGWRGAVIDALGSGYDPACLWANLIHGALYFVPVYIVSVSVGGLWEGLFAVVRRHDINEGFLVTSLLFPLALPPTIPLWQVAAGISFGVVIGKEIFGGVGYNFLNPALTGRAFLFFAYPASFSLDEVWVAVDGLSGATPLANAAAGGMQALDITYMEAFLGTIRGSMGETSTLACLIGAAVLVITRVASWRVMLSMLAGALCMASLLWGVGSETNVMFSMPPHWHLVLGGFAFGTVFMATDPVSSAMTFAGQYIYGALVGVMVITVRVVNPAFPEGVMLAILLGNTFAPLIDYYVVRATIRRRALRHA